MVFGLKPMAHKGGDLVTIRALQHFAMAVLVPVLSFAAFVVYMADHLGGWLSVWLSTFREKSDLVP